MLRHYPVIVPAMWQAWEGVSGQCGERERPADVAVTLCLALFQQPVVIPLDCFVVVSLSLLPRNCWCCLASCPLAALLSFPAACQDGDAALAAPCKQLQMRLQFVSM